MSQIYTTWMARKEDGLHYLSGSVFITLTGYDFGWGGGGGVCVVGAGRKQRCGRDENKIVRCVLVRCLIFQRLIIRWM